MKNNKWVRLLAYVTGSVNQELLLQNEPPSPRSANASGARPCERSLELPNLIPSWPGIGSWSPGSSMAL